MAWKKPRLVVFLRLIIAQSLWTGIDSFGLPKKICFQRPKDSSITPEIFIDWSSQFLPHSTHIVGKLILASFLMRTLKPFCINDFFIGYHSNPQISCVLKALGACTAFPVNRPAFHVSFICIVMLFQYFANAYKFKWN